MNTSPRIWVPKCKILEPREAMTIPVGLSGRFKMEAIRPDGRVRPLTDWFPNLITNAGLNAIGTTSGWLSACRVGTGSTTPNVSDTAMASFLAGTTGTGAASVASAASTPPYFGSLTKTFQFAVGVAAGNLAEVGVASQAAVGGTQFSRALILDGGGSPTTITVLSDEILNVSYQLQTIVPPTDVISTITISGVDYDIVTRAADATASSTWSLGSANGVRGGCFSAQAWSGTIGAITSSPSGSSSVGTNTDVAYSDNSLQRDTTFDWGLSSANYATTGIRALSFYLGNSSQMGRMQISFAMDSTPANGIVKTSSQVLALVCRHTWARGTAI